MVISGLLMGLNAIDYNVLMRGEEFDRSVRPPFGMCVGVAWSCDLVGGRVGLQPVFTRWELLEGAQLSRARVSHAYTPCGHVGYHGDAVKVMILSWRDCWTRRRTWRNTTRNWSESPQHCHVCLLPCLVVAMFGCCFGCLKLLLLLWC